MFSSGSITIKNEPINREDTEDTDFVAEEFCLQNIVIKCERTTSCDLDIVDCVGRPKTIICTESDYLADGNVAFESIVVKEEPKLNVCPDSLLQANFNGEEELPNNFECYICRHVVSNALVLRRHVEGHIHKKLQHKEIHRPKRLDRHKPSHRDKNQTKKTFACDECGRKCLRKSTLKQHKLIHTGQRPFACDECDRKFSDSSTLYKHKQRHSGEKPFACTICDRKCLRKSTLARHLKTHSGEKSFTCDVCNKKFSRNSTLNHHKLIHSGENPYECDQCDRKFKIKSTLNYHVQTHSGEKPFTCQECDRKFLTKANLNSHMKRHPLKGDKSTRNTKKKSKYATLMSKCKSLCKI